MVWVAVLGVVFVIDEGRGIEAAEQPLRAVLAGLRVALGMDARLAGVEVLGEVGEDAVPFGDLVVEGLEGERSGLGKDAIGGRVAVEAHLLAGADAAEGDGGELCVGDHGVERELRLVGALGEPILVAGGAGLVVDEDVAGVARLGGVDAIDAQLQAQRTDGDLHRLFARLDREGQRSCELLVDPGGEEAAQAFALGVDVLGFPRGGRDGDALRERLGDGAVECGGAFLGRHGLECRLGADLVPEALQRDVNEVAALARVHAGLGGLELGGPEAALGEGAEAAGGLRFKHACAAANQRIRERDAGVVGDCFELDDRLFGCFCCRELCDRCKRREGEIGEKRGGPLRALRGLARVAEDDRRGAGGDALGDAARVLTIGCRVGAGHAERALQWPAEQGIDRGAGRPVEVAGAQEPHRVELRAAGLERTHDLHRRLTRLGCEQGVVEQRAEGVEGLREGGADALEVEGGELVERALPLAASLEGDAVLAARDRSPVGGLQHLAHGVRPIGIGALWLAGEDGCSGAAQRPQLAQQAAQA